MKLSKKLVALGMVFALALGMALSAFADYDGSYSWKKAGTITATQGVGAYTNLNLEGSSTNAYDHRNVTLYSRTGSKDQDWIIERRAYIDGVCIYTVRSDLDGNNDYTLNYIQSAPHNCDILRYKNNVTKDCWVIVKGSPTSFYVELQERVGTRLNYQRSGVGRNVYWGTAYDYWHKA